jgi:ABC-2 type transport system ATP-binding protein
VTPAIETEDLTRRFGGILAVDRVGLSVPCNAVFGFIGRNGAGKTTTIRLLLGLLRPNAGKVRIFGLDVGTQRIAAARKVGSLVEVPFHYDHLTGRENLAITAGLLGVARTEIDRVLELVGLSGSAGRRVGGFSLGMRQRLGLARALLGRPRLLILDEPTNGLDPDGIRDMRALISGLPEREGVTVFVSSHVLAELEHVATHVGLMEDGRLVAQGALAALKAAQARRVTIRTRQPDRLVALLAAAGIGCGVAPPDRVVVDDASAEAAARDIAAINFLMVEQGIEVLGIEVAEPSLEDVFLRGAGRAAAANAAATAAAAAPAALAA